MSRVLLIDNYDSFTFNVVQGLAMLGADVVVRRNDVLDEAAAEALGPTHLVISPGPGRPEDAGVSPRLLRHFAGRVPVLGVCLGHQALAVAFGGTVGPAARLMHGKTSRVRHDGRGLFEGLPSPVEVGRYHSLAVTAVPDCLRVTAVTDDADAEIMALSHLSLPVHGVQFHPESVLTPCGQALLGNFLRLRA